MKAVSVTPPHSHCQRKSLEALRRKKTARKQDALKNRTPHPEWPEQTVCVREQRVGAESRKRAWETTERKIHKFKWKLNIFSALCGDTFLF